MAVPLSHPSSCHVRHDVGASRPQEVEFMETKAMCEQQLFTHGKTVKEGFMNMRHLLLAVLSMLVGWGTAGVAQAAPTVSFEAGDRPGNFFTCSNTANSKSLGCVPRLGLSTHLNSDPSPSLPLEKRWGFPRWAEKPARSIRR